MRARKFCSVLVAITFLAVAQPESNGQDPMGTAFKYQGRLTDGGSPANGEYDFRFRLYDSDDLQVGSQIGTENVSVTSGLFTLPLDFGAGIFTGKARFLEIEIRPGDSTAKYTILSPKQELTPAPYALYADSVGTIDVPLVLTGGENGPLLSVTNNGASLMDGHGIKGSATESYARGVWGEATDIGGKAVYGEATLATENTTNYAGYFTAASGSGYGVYAQATHTGDRANTGVAGFAAGAKGRGVYGEASHTGIDPVNFNYGGYFTAASQYGEGVYAEAEGWMGKAVHGEATGVASSTNYGGYFRAAGRKAQAVYGEATETSDYENYGGYFKAGGRKGRAVYGEATSTSGLTVGESYGGYFLAASPVGRGVHGEVTSTGSVTTFGGQFLIASYYGAAVYGEATTSTGTSAVYNYGGYFKTASPYGRGVYGEAARYGVYGKATDTNGYAVYGQANGTGGYGVYGKSPKYGVYGKSTGVAGYAVYGEATNENGYGGYFTAPNLGATGIYAEAAADAAIAGHFVGEVQIDGDLRVTGGDLTVAGYTRIGSFYTSGASYDVQVQGDGDLVRVSSSERYKKDIEDLKVDLDEVLKLRPVTFKWKETEEEDIGLIAEEVDKVSKDLVVYDGQGKPDAVKYDRVAVHLLAVVKDQQKRITELEATIAEKEALEQRIAVIEKALQQLRSSGSKEVQR